MGWEGLRDGRQQAAAANRTEDVGRRRKQERSVQEGTGHGGGVEGGEGKKKVRVSLWYQC